MCNQYSLNYLWQAPSQEGTVLLEEVEADAFLSVSIITKSLIKLLFLLIILIVVVGSCLPHFSFFAHLTHACKLRPYIIYFHSTQLVFIAYNPNFFSFQHSSGLIWVIIVVIFILLAALLFSYKWW